MNQKEVLIVIIVIAAAVFFLSTKNTVSGNAFRPLPYVSTKIPMCNCEPAGQITPTTEGMCELCDPRSSCIKDGTLPGGAIIPQGIKRTIPCKGANGAYRIMDEYINRQSSLQRSV